MLLILQSVCLASPLHTVKKWGLVDEAAADVYGQKCSQHAKNRWRCWLTRGRRRDTENLTFLLELPFNILICTGKPIGFEVSTHCNKNSTLKSYHLASFYLNAGTLTCKGTQGMRHYHMTWGLAVWAAQEAQAM